MGADFERWGYTAEQINEADWWQTLELGDVTAHLVPSRHYSGRGLTRNKVFWGGYVLESPARRFYFSGDTGYGPHFAQMRKKFGSFVLVETGSVVCGDTTAGCRGPFSSRRLFVRVNVRFTLKVPLPQTDSHRHRYIQHERHQHQRVEGFY